MIFFPGTHLFNTVKKFFYLFFLNITRGKNKGLKHLVHNFRFIDELKIYVIFSLNHFMLCSVCIGWIKDIFGS